MDFVILLFKKNKIEKSPPGLWAAPSLAVQPFVLLLMLAYP
jgi:hypothetical protein